MKNNTFTSKYVLWPRCTNTTVYEAIYFVFFYCKGNRSIPVRGDIIALLINAGTILIDVSTTAYSFFFIQSLKIEIF